jgi:transcriptional regulator with XRE-family HTH domain
MSEHGNLNRRTGERIREAREARGLSLEKLGAEVGLTKPNLSKAETNGSNITLDLLESVAKALHLTPAQLLGETPLSNLAPEPRDEDERALFDAVRSRDLIALLSAVSALGRRWGHRASR